MGCCFYYKKMGQTWPRIGSLPAFVKFCSGLKLKDVVKFCQGVTKFCQGVASAPPRPTLNEALPVVIHYKSRFLHKSNRIK